MTVLVLHLLLLLPSLAHATIVLAWDWDGARESLTSFELTMQVGTLTRRFQVPASPPGACPHEPPSTYCAQLPACPTPGATVTFTVAASGGPPSEAFACQATGSCTCVQPGVEPGSPGAPGQGVPAATLAPESPPPAALPPGTMLIETTPPPPPPDVLPPILTQPPLPAFQPAASRAPV